MGSLPESTLDGRFTILEFLGAEATRSHPHTHGHPLELRLSKRIVLEESLGSNLGILTRLRVLVIVGEGAVVNEVLLQRIDGSGFRGTRCQETVGGTRNKTGKNKTVNRELIHIHRTAGGGGWSSSPIGIDIWM